jgi:acetyltransferase-like isoleucine patch superfamily enzyme
MLKKIYNALKRRAWCLFYKRAFKKLGARSYVQNPLHIMGKKNIIIEDDVFVAYKTWLAAVSDTNSDLCELIIGRGTRIGNFNHIYATRSIKIGRDVLTADKVYISDNLHDYEEISLPIIKQKIKQINSVEIGDGVWIGENVCVIGAKIGKNSVIGANSVVTKDIPAYCVAVGSPAKIIKRYSFERQAWVKTTKDGNFIN